MKILFICSGKDNGSISPVIENQISILKKYNQTINVYTIDKKGLKGYLQSIIPLRKQIMQSQYDVLHSHYLFCGIVALFSAPNANHVLSIMGSDIREAGGLVSFSKRFDRAGIMVMETSNDISTATDMATAISLNNWPASSCMISIGTKTRTVVNADTRTAGHT